MIQLLTQEVHDRVRSCCPCSGMCYMGILAVTEAQQVCRTSEIKQCLMGLRPIVLLCEYPHSRQFAMPMPSKWFTPLKILQSKG